MSKASSKSILGLYFHIPYCLKKCGYCAFTSNPGRAVPDQYVSSLKREVNWIPDLLSLRNSPADTLYFGGGTPSLMTPEAIGALLDEISSNFIISDKCEVTLEVNPATADKKKLKAFKKAGINRLSMGLQSFHPGNLKFLDRLHSVHEAISCIQMAKDAGYENISLDFIYGLPGQTVDNLMSDLKEAILFDPQHISLYLLSLEEGTPLYLKAKKGQFMPAEDTLADELFSAATSYLRDYDYIRYETSNYAKNGFQSRHNLKYWNGDSYLGFGTAAHSYLKDIGWGLRWWNVRSSDEYIRRLANCSLPIDDVEMLSRENALLETVFTSLRTDKGLRDDYLRSRFGITLEEAISLTAIERCPEHLLLKGKESLRLTDKGALLADELSAAIIK